MLRNTPTLWRLSVLDMIWWAICAHLIAYLWGRSVSDIDALYVSSTEIAGVQAGYWWVIAILGVFWAISLIRWPMIDTSWRTVLVGWFAVVCLCYAFLVVPNAYFSSLTEKMTFRPGSEMTKLEKQTLILRHQKFLSEVAEPHVFESKATPLICSDAGRVNTEVLDELDQIASDLSFPWRTKRQGDDVWLKAERKCQEQEYDEVLKLLTQGVDGVSWRSRATVMSGILSARLFALDFSTGSSLVRYLKAVIQPAALPVALILGTLFLAVTHYAASYAQSFRSRHPGTAVGQWTRLWSPFARYDRELVRNSPLSWAFGAHRSVLVSFVVILFAFLLREHLLEGAEGLTDWLDTQFGTVASSTAVILIPLLLASLSLVLFWYQKRYVDSPETLDHPLRLLMALQTPPQIALMVVLILFHIGEPIDMDELAGGILILSPPVIWIMAVFSVLATYRGIIPALISTVAGVALAVGVAIVGGLLFLDSDPGLFAAFIVICFLNMLASFVLHAIFKNANRTLKFIVDGATVVAVALPAFFVHTTIGFGTGEVGMDYFAPLAIPGFILTSWIFVSPFISSIKEGQFVPRDVVHE